MVSRKNTNISIKNKSNKKKKKSYQSKFFDIRKYFKQKNNEVINNNLSYRQIGMRLKKIIKEKKMKPGDIFYIGEEELYDNDISLSSQQNQFEGWGLVVPTKFTEEILSLKEKTNRGYILSDSGPNLLLPSKNKPFSFVINKNIKYKNAIKNIKNWENGIVKDHIKNTSNLGYQPLNNNKWRLFFEYGITLGDIKKLLSKYDSWD
jgi:hypothetical protein